MADRGEERAHPAGLRAGVADWGDRVLVAVSAAGVAAGGALALAGAGGAADVCWAATVAIALAPLVVGVTRRLLARDVGVDVIALVSMAGALALGEYLAGAVIALMLSGGNALEGTAGRRARRELTVLLQGAPKTAHRRRGDAIEEVAVDDVATGDVLVIRAGEILPVDGEIVTARAVLDESTLTGEPMPRSCTRGDAVRSGTANAGDPFELRATRPAAESAYAALVRLVRGAETQRAPFVRLADRYAVVLLAVTTVLAGGAWALSGDPVRALAVFVVATPCPLILAAPIALISGVSRAARVGVIVKGATTIERLGAARTVLFDKTGTLTLGAPQLERTVVADGAGEDEVLRLAASVDQLSTHVLGAALVRAAHDRNLALEVPREVVETPGQGIEGMVSGRRVAVGSGAWLAARGDAGAAWRESARAVASAPPGRARVHVAIDGRPGGVLVMGDRLRADARGLVARLHELGVRHVALVTGDAEEVARQIGDEVGVDRVYADQTPEAKLDVVRSVLARPECRSVVMVGDGVNDAPALALADVGIAVATEGATVSSETADAVITVDRIDRVAEAIRIGVRALRIARQSVIAGIGLSSVAMVVAATGNLAPVAGALVQEAIDVGVILNALRVLRG